MNQTAQLFTAADLEKMPANGERYELVNGELRTMPPVGGEHGVIGMNLSGPMHSHSKANDLGVVLLAETGFILKRDPDTVRAADTAFVRKNRIPNTGIPKAFWPGYPDLAVEVVSPGDTLYEVEEKVEAWLDAGTSLVWVVNPRRRTVTVYHSLQNISILTENDYLDGEQVLPGFRLRVGDIFV